MSPALVVQLHLEESVRVKQALAASQSDRIVQAAEVMAGAIARGHKILWCGNGGSASDSQHLATELVVRLVAEFERPAIASIALTTDTSLLTACANDLGYERVFSRQVEALGQSGDVLVGITTSGNSRNVVLALEEARRRRMETILLSAGDGGACAALCDVAILVPSKVTSHIQESHIAVGHILCELIERLAFGRR